MITAVDTSVLLDVFGADPRFGEPSREAGTVPSALVRVPAEGPVVDRQPGGVVSAGLEGADVDRPGGCENRSGERQVHPHLVQETQHRATL